MLYIEVYHVYQSDVKYDERIDLAVKCSFTFFYGGVAPTVIFLRAVCGFEGRNPIPAGGFAVHKLSVGPFVHARKGY